MIVVTNKFLPTRFKRIKKKDQKPIADTDEGDLAYYVTSIEGGGSMSDSDDDDDEHGMSLSSSDFTYEKPQKSLTGADWRPCFNDRMTMFIAGTPGAGKSYLAKQMIKLLPSNIPILLFTALEENDGNFDELGTDRMFKIKMKPEVFF